MTQAFVSQSAHDWARHLDDTLERWQYARENIVPAAGNDVRKMDAARFAAYLKHCDLDELHSLKQELDIINVNVRNSLSKRTRCQETPAFLGWKHAAIRVRKTCGVYSNCIQTELSQRTRRHTDPLHVIFTNLIYESGLIEKSQLDSLMAEARRIHKGEK